MDPRVGRRLVIGLVLPALAAPTYLDSEARIRIPVTVSARDVRRQVRRLRRTSDHTLFWSADGQRAQVLPHGDGTVRFGALGEAAHLAWVIGLGMELAPETEWDFIVRPVQGGPRPVTIWSDANKGLTVAVGTRVPALTTSDWPTLTERFGLQPAPTSLPLDPELLGAIELAYEALDPVVAHALRDVAFTRRPVPGDRQGLQPDVEPGARYLGRHHRIEVYDKAIGRTTRFVGDVDAPHHPLVSLLLHELGHALTHLPRVEAQRARRTLDDTPTDGALAARFDSAIGGHANAPTVYGRTSPAESFAEAFALHHLDPDALQRACPEGAAWFSSRSWEEHLRSTRPPPPAPARSTPPVAPG